GDVGGEADDALRRCGQAQVASGVVDDLDFRANRRRGEEQPGEQGPCRGANEGGAKGRHATLPKVGRVGVHSASAAASASSRRRQPASSGGSPKRRLAGASSRRTST